MFGSVKFAEFKNLSMTDVDGSAAALVGTSEGYIFKNISVSGKIVSGGDDGSVGAVSASRSGSMEKCKNSAKITAKTNIGSKKGRRALRQRSHMGKYVTRCYSMGTVKAAKDHRGGFCQGRLIGYWEGPHLAGKRLIYDNYYTRSGKAYGAGDTDW